MAHFHLLCVSEFAQTHAYKIMHLRAHTYAFIIDMYVHILHIKIQLYMHIHTHTNVYMRMFFAQKQNMFSLHIPNVYTRTIKITNK